MNNESIETVVLIHEPNELLIALKKFPQCQETLYCTLTPHASEQCEKKGVKYKPLEDFGLNSDPNQLRDNIHQNLLKTIAIADQVTQKHYTKKPYISPYRASFRRLTILLSGTRVRVFYLSSLIEKTQTKQIVWFGKPARVLGCYDGNEAFSADGSVEIALLKFQPWEGVDLVDHSTDTNNFPRSEIQSSLPKVMKFLKNNNFEQSLKFHMKMLKVSGWDFIKSYLRPPVNHIFIENYTPFWLETCKLLLRRGQRIHSMKDYYSYLESWQSRNSSLETELHQTLLESGILNWKSIFS